MKKKLFQVYSELEIQRKQIDDQMASLKVQIVDEMDKEAVDKIESDFGVFYFTERKAWSYSEVIKEKETELKQIQKDEQASGVAEATVSRSLTFRPKKNGQ